MPIFIGGKVIARLKEHGQWYLSGCVAEGLQKALRNQSAATNPLSLITCAGEQQRELPAASQHAGAAGSARRQAAAAVDVGGGVPQGGERGGKRPKLDRPALPRP